MGLGGHAFLDGPAGDRIDALGISALPAATGLYMDAVLAVGSFLYHYDPAFDNTNKYHKISGIAITRFQIFLRSVRRSIP